MKNRKNNPLCTGSANERGLSWPAPSHTMMMIAACIVCSFVLVMLLPNEAHAGWMEDAIDAMNDWFLNIIKTIVLGICSGLLEMMFKIISWFTGVTNVFSGDWGNLFGNLAAPAGATDSVYHFFSAVNQTVLTLAHSILALLMLVQTVRISQKFDANATLPAVKEVFFLFVFFVLFTWLINNSMELCGAIYDEVNTIITKVVGVNGNAGDFGSVNFIDNIGDISAISLNQCITLFLVLIIATLILMAGLVVAYLMAAARAFQLYFLAACSPLPFALLGFEETRSMGIGFIKNFAAVCLAGLVMILSLAVYPILLGNVITSFTFFSDVGSFVQAMYAGSGGGTILMLFQCIAYTLLFVVALVKSGAWARDLLGS